jgi:hypothetical protein
MADYRLDYDDWGRLVTVRRESLDELKAVADVCKSLQNEGLTGTREMRHLAEFPGFLIEAYCHQHGIEWNEWFQNPVHCQRMLQDPDLAHFRVDRSRVALRGE